MCVVQCGERKRGYRIGWAYGIMYLIDDRMFVEGKGDEE